MHIEFPETLATCSAVVPRSICKVVNGEECWCKQDDPNECPCDNGCDGGWNSGMSAYELCGYQSGYSGKYYSATEAVAMEFGLPFYSHNPDCFNNHATASSLTPLECPESESYCRNGLCNWKTVHDQWNEQDHCTVQSCCVPIVRCTNLENNGIYRLLLFYA